MRGVKRDYKEVCRVDWFSPAFHRFVSYLGISGDTLYRYASEGFIPAFKLGNRWRFKKSLLDAWMDEKSGVKAPAPVTVMPKQKKPAGKAR